MRQKGKTYRALIATGLVATAVAATTVIVTRAWEAVDPATANQAGLLAAIEGNTEISVLGLGSSVGAGATLLEPATDAPAARLGRLLQELSTDNVVDVVNDSVGGSVAYDGWEAFKAEAPEEFPTVVLLAYGMNEGHPFAYNAGTTFPVNKNALAELASAYREGGSTVMIATTPSPDSATTPWEISPEQSIYYPEGATALVPSPSESVVTVDEVPFSVRHAEFNAFARSLSAENGYILVDVVPFWNQAVKERGEAALYTEGSYNHPNLSGHQASYWPALSEIVSTLSSDEARR